MLTVDVEQLDSDEEDEYGLPVGGSSALQGREDLDQGSLDPSAARQAFKGKYLRPGGTVPPIQHVGETILTRCVAVRQTSRTPSCEDLRRVSTN